MTAALPNQIPMQQAANPATQAADPLAALRDIHLPEAIGWWPVAPGWWLLLGLSIMLIAALFYYLRWRKIQSNRPAVFSTQQVMHTALLEFTAIEQRHNESKGTSDEHARRIVADISQLLRRAALQLNHEPDAVAGLTGNAWLSWLDGRWDRDDFNQGAGRILIDAPYRSGFSDSPDLNELLSLCRDWLEQQS